MKKLIHLNLFFMLFGALFLFAKPALAADSCTSAASGNWYVAATWANCSGSFPSNSDTATILSGHTVSMDGDLTGHSLAGITVSTGGILATSASRDLNGHAITVNGTFRIDEGGFAHTGSFVYGSNGTLEFANTSGVFGFSNSHVFWPASSAPVNVIVSGTGGLDMNDVARTVSGTISTVSGLLDTSNLTVAGTLQINTGGYIGGNGAPTYNAGSTLKYNTGAYNAGQELTNSPANVTLTGSTNLTLNNAKANTFNGNLQIDSGTKMNMASMNSPYHLTVTGNVSFSGELALSLGTANIIVGGNWTKGGSGVFTHNDSYVTFNGGGTRTITGAMSGSTNRFAKIIVTNNTALQHISNIGITSGLEVGAGSSIAPTTTAPSFVQEVATAGAVLDCDGSCSFNALTVRTIDASGSAGSIDVNGTFSIAVATGAFVAPPVGIPFTIAGDFTSAITSGTFTANGGTVTFDGTTQNLDVSAATAFAGITVASTSTLIEVDSAEWATATTITNNGVIRKSQSNPPTGALNFGLTHVDMVVNTTCTGTFTVDRRDSDHASATTGISTTSEMWWGISSTCTGFNVDLIFEDHTITANTEQKTCRYTTVWDCVPDADPSATIARRNSVTGFSGWAACNGCGPTAVVLQTNNVIGKDNSLNLVLVLLFGIVFAVNAGYWFQQRRLVQK